MSDIQNIAQRVMDGAQRGMGNGRRRLDSGKTIRFSVTVRMGEVRRLKRRLRAVSCSAFLWESVRDIIYIDLTESVVDQIVAETGRYGQAHPPKILSGGLPSKQFFDHGFSRFEISWTSPGKLSHTEQRISLAIRTEAAALAPIRPLRIPRALLSNTRAPGCLGKHDGLLVARTKVRPGVLFCVPIAQSKDGMQRDIGCVLRGTAVRWRPRANWEESCGTRPTPLGARKIPTCQVPIVSIP